MGLARGHRHMVPGHQLGKTLCRCTAPPGTASSILPSPLGRGGLPCTGHGRTSELPGKGASLPAQVPLQKRLPIISSSGEGFCTAGRTYSFKIEAGATNVRAALAATARCGQQEGYGIGHMPLSVTGTALRVGPRKGFHQHVLTHLCLAAAAGPESAVCVRHGHDCLRGGGDGPGCKAAATAQPVCSHSAAPARCSRNSFHSAQVKTVLVCT